MWFPSHVFRKSPIRRLSLGRSSSISIACMSKNIQHPFRSINIHGPLGVYFLLPLQWSVQYASRLCSTCLVSENQCDNRFIHALWNNRRGNNDDSIDISFLDNPPHIMPFNDDGKPNHIERFEEHEHETSCLTGIKEGGIPPLDLRFILGSIKNLIGQPHAQTFYQSSFLTHYCFLIDYTPPYLYSIWPVNN